MLLVLYNPQRLDPMGDGSGNPYDQKGKGRANQNGDVLALDLDSAEEGSSRTPNGFMQMQLVEQQASNPHFYLFILSSLLRIRIFNNVLQQLSLSRPPLPNLDKFSRSWLIWLQNNGKQCNALTRIPTTSCPTLVRGNANYSNIMPTSRVVDG